MRNVYLSDYDFIGLSETWLSPKVNTSELGLSNYITYRYDRKQYTNNRSRGGGVLLSINNKFHSRLLPLPISPVEYLFVIININNSYIIIGNVYYPPRTDISIYNAHFDIINNILSCFPYVSNVIMVDDYNFPKLQFHVSSIGYLSSILCFNIPL